MNNRVLRPSQEYFAYTEGVILRMVEENPNDRTKPATFVKRI